MASSGASETKEKDGKTENNEVVFLAPECPVEKVTVYPDRAEVCRRVEGTLEAGLNQVVIKKLPDMVDSDSIRVEGKGAATITEVVFHSEHVPKGEGDSSAKEKELEAEKEELTRHRRDLDSELTVLKKQWGLLDSFSATASKGGVSKKDQDGAPGGIVLNDSFFKGLTDFLQLYSKEGNSLEKKQLELERRVAAVDQKVDANAANLRKLKENRDSRNEIKKCIILVDCKESCKVSLLVSYVTSSASWSPSYDIRMYTAEDMLKITYYGQIQQSTGEDWVDAKLYLSTAQPSIGGEVPELLTAELRLRRPHSASVSKRKKGRTKSALGFGGVRRSFRGVEDNMNEMLDDIFSFGEEATLYGASPAVTYAEAEVGEGVATTMYEIARRSTIPSDNVEHKVTVGLVDIKPKISYSSIPQRVPHAFMLAKVTNSSPYTFLSGVTSIFLDNTFVGKASMKDVYPMEEFDCSLGVDPAVKVTYKPQKKNRGSSGLISKVTSNTHEQVIEVKNTHDYGIKIVVTDQLPRSADDRVKVNLLEPQIDLKHPEKSKDKDVALNSSNNLEWTLDLKPMETREITLKYTVDHPSSFTLHTNELRSSKA